MKPVRRWVKSVYMTLELIRADNWNVEVDAKMRSLLNHVRERVDWPIRYWAEVQIRRPK